MSQPFSPTEFPNYFLPEKFRGTSPKDIPEAEVARARTQLESAMQSVLSRLTLPLVPEGETAPSNTRYFPHLSERLRQIDPNAKLVASGGVVRAAISYLYNEMYQGARGIPPRSPEEVLQEIIQSKVDLPGFHMRGVGSDFDALLKDHTVSLSVLQEEILRITNSAGNTYSKSGGKDGLYRALFVVGDVKDYREQTTRTTRQGGANIDFLSFDIERGVFIEPNGHGNIVNDLLRGWYSYLPPENESLVEDGPKQTIRGGRGLLELPFTQLKDDSQLRIELEDLIEDIRSGRRPTNKAVEQFAKMVRNSREAGAHNRFYRTPGDSIESLFLEVDKLLRTGNNAPLLPEFVDRFPLKGRSPALTASIKDLLMPVKQFRSEHTADGTLYHGTPSMESGLAIIRGGLFLSKSDQGTAYFGRGAYTTPSIATAQGYAGKNGIVFPLQVRTDQSLSILDWKEVETDPRIQAIVAKAASLGRDPFEYLAREYGIDIIINGHVLIQNQEAIEIPENRTLVEAFANTAKNPNAEPHARMTALSDYRELFQFAHASGGGAGLEDPEKLFQSVMNEVESSLRAKLNDPNAEASERVESYQTLLQVGRFLHEEGRITEKAQKKRENDYKSQLVQGLKRVLSDSRSARHLQYEAGSALVEMGIHETALVRQIASLLKKDYEKALSPSETQDRMEAIYSLSSANVRHPDVEEALKLALKVESEGSVAARALETLTQMGYRGPELLEVTLDRLLENPDGRIFGDYLLTDLLTEFKPSPEKVVPALEKILQRNPREFAVLKALAHHQPDHPRVVPALLEILDSEMKGWHGPSFEIFYRPEIKKPPEAIALFRKIFRDPNSSDVEKQRPALALASTGIRDIELLKPLATFYDPKPEIMKLAQKVLVEFPFTPDRETLMALLSNINYGSQLEGATRELLSRWHQTHSEVESVIRDSLASDKFQPEKRLAFLAELIPRQKETLEMLQRLVDSKYSHPLQEPAARALEAAGLGSDRTQEVILNALDCPRAMRTLAK